MNIRGLGDEICLCFFNKSIMKYVSGKGKPKVQQILESVFVKAVEKLTASDNQVGTNKLYVQLDLAAGEIQVYDGKENLLEKNIVYDWASRYSENDVDSYKQPVQSIRSVLTGLKLRNFFENPLLSRPFYVIWADDSFNELEELMELPDTVYVAEGPLMKNLEQELRIFSKKLFGN